MSFSQPVSTNSSILTEIYQPQYNISIWQRKPLKVMISNINHMLETSKPLALVQRLDSAMCPKFHVALLKGSVWQSNESTGLVHRSPMLNLNERRLPLTLDLI